MSAPKFAGMSGKPLMRAITTCATMDFLLFEGVMSSIIDLDPFNDDFTTTKGDSTMQGVVTAIYEPRRLFGAVFILFTGDWLGRRLSIILGVIIQVTSFVGHFPLAQFIIGRVITGVGNGMNTSTIPTYQAECSRTSNSGLLICIEGATIAFGTLVAYWTDYGASYGSPGLNWRFPIAFQIVFGLTVVFGMFVLPESPGWFFTQERYENGGAVITALMGKDISHHDVQLQKTIILDSIRAKNTPLSAVFTGGKTQHFRRMLLGASSQIFQQIGVPVMFMVLGGVNMIVYSISATASWFLIERIGRRMLFWWGTYLFFACINACFLPLIYLFSPETAGRSLEEIDLIFAEGFVENMNYVRAAKALPYLTDEEIERVAIQDGSDPSDVEATRWHRP
ncbi:hypothetical protein BDV12DRAFT_184967 [Aspergillus spectabilis]